MERKKGKKEGIKGASFQKQKNDQCGSGVVSTARGRNRPSLTLDAS